MFIFRDKSGSKISIPWFIFLFVLAMVANTYLAIPEALTSAIVLIAKRALVVTLFLIGAGLSIGMVKKVGIRPLLLAILLWIIIGVSSFFVVMATIPADTL